jgi:uncharacterized protein
MSDYIYLIAPAVGWAAAMIIKVVLASKEGGRGWQDILRDGGGMPSSHTSFMVALATVIGLNEGIDSVVFAIVASLTLIIIYDSTGVRRTTGEQTVAIAEIEKHAKEVLKSKIHNSRGHNYLEALAGCALGLVVGLVLYAVIL